MKEPPRNNKIESLWEPFAARIKTLIARMIALGYDPVIFEALRSEARQKWLYGIGRTHSKRRKAVTWTVHSRHLVGKAVDIISKSHGWNWPEFYEALHHEIHQIDGLSLIAVEACHVQWSG